MNENIAQWVAVVVGVALIVIYSGLMIANGEPQDGPGSCSSPASLR